MKQHTIRRKTLAVIAAAAMMLANFALSNSALADTGRANPQSDVTVIAFQQSWNTIAQECQETYGPEGVGYVQISPPMTKAQMQSFHSGDLGHTSFTILAYCFWVISIPPKNRMPLFRRNTRKEI